MRTFLSVLFAVAALSLPAAASAVAPSPLGTWDTSWGPLTITAASGQLTGAFGSADSWNTPPGHIAGTVSGSTLAGTWLHDAPSHFAPRDHGTVRLTFTTAGGKATFTGKVTYEVDGYTIDWTGTCVSGACAADTAAPTVTAIAASGKPGTAIPLRYRVSDASNKTSETITVYRGTTRIWSTTVRARTVTAGAIYQVIFKAPARAGTLRFTVQARDAAGNASAPSSATVVVR